MEAVNGVAEGPPPPSPSTGCYLSVVLGEPHTASHKDIISQRSAKGLLSWNVNECLVDLEKELTIVTEQGLEGEEARYGERSIQFASENLVTEILIHPSVSTLVQCVRNLLSSFTRHRHIIHAGYTFAANGSWILQDGTFSLADFAEAFQEIDVQRVIRAYENGISFDIHCSAEGEWMRLPKESFTRGCKLRVNPDDRLDSGTPAIANFVNYISPFLVPAESENTLESSDVVGNIRFSRPTLYVFPGGQGDAALFGINGFNMSVDGGFSRKACFWDFVRHLDRSDAVMLTRSNNSNANGIGAVSRRKAQNAVYPQIGHFFCNIQNRKANLSPDGDKDKDPLVVNLLEEGHELVSNLRSLESNPQSCYRDSEPINLYHKVGHGTLDMYVINPAKDSKEVKEFLLRWNSNDLKLFANHKFSRECMLPLQNIVSICALLVWRPANPNDTITRILFPGSAPQNKIFEGLDRLKNLECIKHTVCTEKTLTPAPKVKSKENILDKIAPLEKPKSEIKKTKPRQMPENKSIENGMQNGHSERIVKKSGSVESDKSESKPPKPKREENKIVENNKQEKEKMQRSKPDTNGLRVRQKPVEKKPSPTTPKKTLDSKKSELDKDTSNQRVRSRISPSATPAKSTKDATNRRVLESKSRAAPKREVKESKPSEKKEEAKKVERKPISRRPKTDTKMPQSPVKRAINGVQKPDSISRKGKLDRDVTTDSSTVSTPSVDQDNSKKDSTKLTPEEVQQLKAQELAELKEEQEAIKELEAVFRKGDKMTTESSNLRKVKDLSIDDKTENEEYSIVEKEIIEPSQPEESETDVKEEETVKLARDSEESEKKKDDSDTKDDLDKDRQVDTEQEESGIGEQETDIEEGEGISKEASIQSPEENKKIISKDDEMKEQALESQPDEKISANIESGATTTAPTSPEDERIPSNEIKEDIVDQIEEKHVKEETKEKETKEEIPVITFTTKTAENSTKLPSVVGIRLDKETRIRDIVKTPDEVADLPVHEEVDVEHLTEYTHERIKSKDELYEDSPVKDEESTSPRKSEESPKEEEKDDKKPIDEEDKIPVIPQEKIEDDVKMSGEADLKENEAMEKSPLQEEMDVHVETTSKPLDIQRKDESKDVKPVELKGDTTEQIISEDKHVHDVHHDQKVVESQHAEKTIEKSIPVEDADKVEYEEKEDDKKDIHINETEKEIAEKEDTNQEKLEKDLNERKEQEKIESVETEPKPEKPSDETQKKSDSVEGTLEKESMKDVPSIPSPEENKEKKISVPEKHVSVPISESNKNLSPSPIKTESEIKISLSSEMTKKDEKEELLQQERQEQVTEGKSEPLKLKETHKDEEKVVEPLKEMAKVVEPHKDHEKDVEQHKEEEHEPDASSPKKSEHPKEELGIQGKEESAKGSVIALAEESEKIQTVSGDNKMSIIEKNASIPTSKTGDEEDKEKPSVLDIEKQELVSKETKSELAKKEHQESVTEALNEALKNEDKECASKKDQDDEKTHEIKSRADEQRKPSIASEEVLATVHDEEIVEFDTKTHVEDSIKTEEVGEKIEKDKDDKSPLTSLEMHEKNPSTDIEKETKAIAQPDNKSEENKEERKPSISSDSKKDHEKPSSDSKISPNETIEISPLPQEKEEIIKLDQKTPELKKSRSPSPIKMTEIEEKKVEEKEHEKETKDEEKPSVKSTPDTKISSDEKLEISRSPSPKVSKETELTTSEPKKSRSPSPTQTGEIITKKSSITEEIHLQVEEGISKDEEQNKVTLSMPDIKHESHIDEKSSPEVENISEPRTSEHIVDKKDELKEKDEDKKSDDKKSDDKKITDSDSKSTSGDENIEKENAMLLGNKMTFEKENKDLEGSATDQVEDTLQRKTSSSNLRKSSDTGISNEEKKTEEVEPAKDENKIESPKKSSPESKMEFELKSSPKSDSEERKPKEKIDDIKLQQTDDENELIETAERRTSVSETVLTEKKDSTTTEKVDDIPEKETKDKPSLPSANSPKKSISMVEDKESKTEESIHSIPSEKDRPADEIVYRKSSISEGKPVNEIPSKEVEKEKSVSQSIEETSEKKIGALESSKPAGEELSEQITSTKISVASEKIKEADAKLSEKDVDESERERTIEKSDEGEKVKAESEKDIHKPAEREVQTFESDNEILKTEDVKVDQLDNELKSVTDERKSSVETIQDSKEPISKSTSSGDIEDKKEDSITDDKESIRVKSPEQEIMGQKTEPFEEIGHHELEITKSSSSVQQTSPTKPKESTAESPEKKTSVSSKEEVPSITPTDVHKEDKEKEIETVLEDDRKTSIEKVESTESFLTRKFSVVHPEKETTVSSDKNDASNRSPSTEVKERSPDSISSVETSTTVTTEKETTQTGSHTERKDSIHEKKEQDSEKGLPSKSEEISSKIVEESEKNSETIMEPHEKSEKLDDKIPDKTKDEISVKSEEETDDKLIKDGTKETQMQSRKSSLIQEKEEISKTSSSAELEVEKPFEEVSTEKVEKTSSPSPIEMTNEDKKSTHDEKTIRDERASEKDQETDIKHETTAKDKNVFDITEPHAETKTETKSSDEKPTSFVSEQYSTDKTEKEVEKTDEKADAPKEKSVTPVEKKSPETSEENQSSSDKVYTLDQQDNKYASTAPQEAEESEDINYNREFPSIKGDKTESIDSNLMGSEEKAVQEEKSKTKSPEDREKVEIIEKQDHETAETEKGSIDDKIDDKTISPQEISKELLKKVEEQKSQEKMPLGEIHDFSEMEKSHSHKERGLPEEKLMTNESKPADESIKYEEPKSGKTSPNQVIAKELQENELKSLENHDEKEIQNPKEDHEQISQDKHDPILTDGKMMKTEKIQIDLTDKPEHAESVVLKSTPESPVINFVPSLPILPTDIDKTELGRKSPKEREEDVAKIVASVATVLKSEAPLEEFHKQIPLYTTESRETHITTCDSPVTEKDIKIEFHDKKDYKDEDSEFLKNSEASIEAKKDEDTKDSSKTEEPEDPGTVHRMLVTASSEDGGEEIEICPVGTITFSRSSESSGRSSPENVSRQLSQTSSILDTISDQNTVKEATEANKEPVVEEVFKVSKGTLEGALKTDKAHSAQPIYPGIDLQQEVKSSEDQIEEAVKKDKKESQTGDEKKEEKPSEIQEILTEALQEVSRDTEDIKESITGKIGHVFGSIFSSASKVSESLGHSITDSVKAVEMSIDEGLKKVESEIGEVKHKIEDVESKVVDTLVEKKEQAEHIVADHLRESVTAISDTIDKTDKAKDSLVKQTEDTLDKMAAPLRETLGDALSNLAESMKHHEEKIDATKPEEKKNEPKETISTIEDATSDEIKNWIESSGGEITQQIYPSLKDATDYVKETHTDVKEPLKESISSLISGATKEIEETLSKIQDTEEVLGKDLEKKEAEAVSGSKDTVGVLDQGILDKKNECSQKGHEISKDIDNEVTETVETTKEVLSEMVQESKKADNEISDAMKSFGEEAKKTIDDINGKMEESKKSIEDGISEAEKCLMGNIEKETDELKKTAAEAIEKSEAAAETIKDGIVNGSVQKVSDTEEQIEDFVKTVSTKGDEAIDEIKKETESCSDAVQSVKNDISAKISDSKETLKESSADMTETTESLKESAKNIAQESQASLDSAKKDLQHTEENLKKVVDSSLENLKDSVQSSAEAASSSLSHLIEKTIHPPSEKTEKDEESELEHDSLSSRLETRAESMMKSYTDEIKDTLKESAESIEEDAKLSFESIKHDIDVKDMKKDALDMVEEKQNTTKSVINDISSIVKEEIDSSLKDLAGIEKTIAQEVPKASSGVVESLKTVTDSAHSLKEDTKDAIKEVTSTISEKSDELAEKTKHEIEKKVSDLRTEVEGTKTIILEKADSLSKEIEDTKDKVEKAFTETKKSVESSLGHIKQDLEKKKDAIAMAESEVKHAVEDVFDAGKKLFGGLFGSKKPKEEIKTKEVEKESTDTKVEVEDSEVGCVQKENRVASEQSGSDSCSHPEAGSRSNEGVNKDKCDLVENLGLGKSGDNSETCDISKGDVQTHLGLAVSQEKKLSISDVEIFVDEKGKDSSSKCDLKTGEKDQTEDKVKEEISTKMIPEKPHITSEDSVISRPSSHAPELDKHITDVPSKEVTSKDVQNVTSATDAQVGSDKCSDSEDDFGTQLHHKMAEQMDPMMMSFYGALPDDDRDDILDDGDDSGRSEVPLTHLHDITKAKFEGKMFPEHVSQFPVQDPMTSSFYGELPGEKDDKDPIESWGKPLGLPSPAPPNEKGTPKKERKSPSNVMAKNRMNDDRGRSESPSKNKKKINPVYVDSTYVPHHGNSNYAYVDFFKRVRARYYVFSGIEPSREVYNALLEAKQTWEDKESEVTIIPTYDTDVSGYWVAENEELLTKYKIDLSPSASRCTINSQDHETSCSAYRLEF